MITMFTRLFPWLGMRQFTLLRGQLKPTVSSSAKTTELLRITVYSRPSCTCCQKALQQLKEWQPRFGFTIEEVNIDTDPELKARYDTTVPVVAVDGVERFRG